MSKNHAEEVAKMLGVEIGEEFYVKEREGIKYKLDEDLILCFFTIRNGRWLDARSDDTLIALLNGSCEVVKKPWKPKDGEKFWCVARAGMVCTNHYAVMSHIEANYKIGNCYRTKEEITPEIVQKWKDFYASDEVIDVFKKEGD